MEMENILFNNYQDSESEDESDEFIFENLVE